MKLRSLLCGVAVGTTILAAASVNAATYTTSDGVLSIETPSDAWREMADPNYWFSISDGMNTITIDHLSNGESLPTVQVANDNYPAVYQAFVSTKNEVFIVKGLAKSAESLQSLMETIQTVKVLKFDTKTAIASNAAPQVSEFGIKEMNAVYYVNADELNVRNGCSTDSALLGVLTLGDQVTVTGSVTKGGADFGWYQIQYNGANAYVSSAFLSAEKPAGSAAAAPSTNTNKTDAAEENKEEAFTVYAADGSWTNIFYDAATKTYQDFKGLVYMPMAGALLYEPVNDTYWDADPNFWKEHNPDEFNYAEFQERINNDTIDEDVDDETVIDQSITVYNEAGDWKTIFHYVEDDTYQDRHGLILEPMAGALFFEPSTGEYWSADASYWDQYSSDDLDYNRFVQDTYGDDIIDDDDEDEDIYEDDEDIIYEDEDVIYDDSDDIIDDDNADIIP